MSDCIHLSADGTFQHVVISDNTFVNRNGNAIHLTGPANQDTHSVVISGNVFDGIGRHGVYLQNLTHYTVSGNHFYDPGDLTANTYDAIHLDTAADSCLVDHNQIFVDTSTPRFGINVLGDCNRIVGNDLGPAASYGTDAINDGGIDNAWKYPDDPVYGDNFTDCEPTPS